MNKKNLQELIQDAGYEPIPWGSTENPMCLAVKPGPNETAFFADLLVSAQGFDLSLSEVIDLVDSAMRNREITKDPYTNEKIFVFRIIRFIVDPKNWEV